MNSSCKLKLDKGTVEMAPEKVVGQIVEMSSNVWSNLYKSITIMLALVLILVVIPVLLLLAGCGIEQYLITHRFRVFRILQVMLGFSSLVYGVLAVFRAVTLRARTDSRLQDPIVPFEKFIVESIGYRRRNPLVIGSVLYCFGFGTILGSISIGVIMLLLSLALGIGYLRVMGKITNTLISGMPVKN
jgi:hypothetical protein